MRGLPALVDALAGADVVLFGERHDDAVAHRLERELLEELARRGRPVVLGMEMFERDVQPALDARLAGTLPEAGFLAASRPWSNYATDYSPLVETARREGWPVVASNVPRAIAATVSRAGLAALDSLPPAERRLAASELECPEDEYFRRFVAEMGEGGHGAPAGAAALLRYYQAQCLKDETMAESLVRARRPGALLVHFHGAFHSDHRLGMVPRLQRRLPDARVVVVSALPAADLSRLAPEQRVADYVILTRELAAGR